MNIVVHRRMGILMEATDVTLGTARPAGLRDFRQIELFGAMGTPEAFFSDTLHTIAIKTRETEFGSIVEPIPIMLKTYKQFQTLGHSDINGYKFPAHPTVSSSMTEPRLPEFRPSTSVVTPSPVKEAKDTSKITRAPPKKKWIREYLEEEPKAPVSVRVVSVPVARSNGVVRVSSPVSVALASVAAAPAPGPTTGAPVPPPAAAPPPPSEPQPLLLPSAAAAPPAQQIVDFAQEHSRPRSTSINSHGSCQIPSPPSTGSSGSSGSAPRAGTREVHNKLEKNRRAHLKECFELLKRQLPATPDDKKTSNLSILGSAIRYIQVLRRKERECEHEMERLAREKIASQQRLAALKRDLPVPTVRPTAAAAARVMPLDTISDDKEMEDRVNGHVLGISIASPPRSPPVSLNLSTKLRALPVQITPTTAQQVIRSTFGSRHNTLTLTTLTTAHTDTHAPNGVVENGVTNALSTLVHTPQIHLPISQVSCTGGLVVSPAALQLLSTGGLRVIHHSHQPQLLQPQLQLQPQPQPTANGISTVENNRIPQMENSIISTAAHSIDGSANAASSTITPVVMSTPIAAATNAHLLHAHTLTHKMVESRQAKGSGVPVSVAQYLSTTLVKPCVVVSAPHTHTHT